MREVNSILLPCSDVLETLKTLKTILINIDKKLEHKLGTRAWYNSYGIAYNGVHLHLSGGINYEILQSNIYKLIDKYGLSPRTVTSWHVFSRNSRYGLKQKRKHQPIYKTPRNTLEIRVLDIEYFLDDYIILDLAKAIEGAYNGVEVEGSTAWVNKLLAINLEEYKKSLEFMESNMSKWWTKRTDGVYHNNNGGYTFDFRTLPEWAEQEERERMVRTPETVNLEELVVPPIILRRSGEIRGEGDDSRGGSTDALGLWAASHTYDDFRIPVSNTAEGATHEL